MTKKENPVLKQKKQLSSFFCLLVSICYLSPGQFPSTFVEEVTIPSTKPGDRLYVCINDFNAADTGSLSLKRGMDTSLLMKYVLLWSIVIKWDFSWSWKAFTGCTSRWRELLLTLMTHVLSLSQHCLLMSLGWGNFYFVVLHLHSIVKLFFCWSSAIMILSLLHYCDVNIIRNQTISALIAPDTYKYKYIRHWFFLLSYSLLIPSHI